MKATAGEVYTVYNQYLKRYTACQVAYIAPPDTVSKESWAVVLSLDWVGDAPLTAEELPHLRPLYKDFMYWSRDLHLLRVPVEVPPQYTLVGTLPPFTDQPCCSYGGWSDGHDVYLQIRWQAIPEERRRAFKEAMESEEKTEIGGIPVKVSSHRVMDQYAPFDSALELKALPCLSDLICERWHPDLLEFLRGNPFISELTLLNHGQRTLDLRGTSIRKLMLDMTGLQELWLGEETEQLLFQNKGPDACTIHAPEDGSGLTLQFIGEYCPHTELPNLRGLHGIELKDFDLTGLAAVHPHLKELRLWGAPGNLGNFSAVGGFRELTNLSTFDLFGFGADDIPAPEQMPELKGIKLVRAGLHIATKKKNRFEPAHAFAKYLKPDDVKQYYECSLEEAEKYLHGDVLQTSDERLSTSKGFILVCYNGLSLGWGKITNGTIKNHYPKGLRINY